MFRISPEKLAKARANFYERGETIAEFARKNGLDYLAVVNTLSGRAKGTRGDSHRAAVLLGLKPTPTKRRHRSIASAEARSS
jgi:gp16 family phage-associated protein